jgi:hypothetical protein
MTRRPLAASRRNPLAVIEPSGYAKIAATARRSGVLSPTSLRAGMWRGFLTSALAYAISRAKHFDRATSRPVDVTSVSLKIEGRCIGIIQFNAMLHFWQIPQSLLVQTRLNLWDQSVPDGKITFWSTSRRRVSNRRLVARKQPHMTRDDPECRILRPLDFPVRQFPHQTESMPSTRCLACS